VSPAVVLNSTPLGILCNPGAAPKVMACRQWLADLLAAGRRVILPEITDYEVRRELIRRGSTVALTNLDGYGSQLEYLPINTAAIQLAAILCCTFRDFIQVRRRFG
jgi:predicted nucleic acid-binding protein